MKTLEFCCFEINMNLFSLFLYLRSEHCIFFVIQTICHFLQINALNDNIFIWNLAEMLSVLNRIKQNCSFYLQSTTVVPCHARQILHKYREILFLRCL